MHAAVEAGAGEAEELGRFAFVLPALQKRRLDLFPLNVFEMLHQRQAARLGCGADGLCLQTGAEPEGQIVEGDQIFTAGGSGFFDDELQFIEVGGPAVFAEAFPDFVAEPADLCLRAAVEFLQKRLR